MEPCSPFKMEQCSPFSNWGYFNEEEGMMGELRHYILQTRMEMEATVIGAQEEILRKEEELTHMKELLLFTIKERDEAQSKINKLMLEKLLLNQLFHEHQQLGHKIQQHNQQKQKTISPSNTTNSTPTNTNCFSASCSESEESSIISSPSGTGTGGANSPATLQPPPLALNTPSAQLPPKMAALLGSTGRPLPERGQFLKAVMEAGPLLQTLLLAGPLPQWKHPPPQLNSIEIPLVSINPFTSLGKRGIDSVEGPITSSPKYQRVA